MKAAQKKIVLWDNLWPRMLLRNQPKNAATSYKKIRAYSGVWYVRHRPRKNTNNKADTATEITARASPQAM
jgi:hypothetical protein